MRVKLEDKTLDDGRVRPIVMYRKHWWSSWKPLLDDEGNLVVRWGFLSEYEEFAAKSVKSILNFTHLNDEQIKARLSMLDMIAWSDNVYVGAKTEYEYSVAYDTPTCSVEDLQNLEIKEG